MAYKAKKEHAPIDESVVIPAAIRAASARADAMHKEAYQTPANSQEPPSEPHTPPEPQTPPPAEPPPAEPQTPPATTPQQAVDENSAEYWRNNYNAMKGRFDRQEGTISGLNNRISQLEGLLASRPAQPPAPPQPARVSPDLTFQPISKEEQDTYGEDFISVAERAALAKLAPTITSLQEELAALKNNVGTVQQRSQEKAMADFYTTLTDALPDWRTINKSDKFKAWLNLTDAFSGATRINLLRDAFEKADANRVLSFFRGFLSDEAATGPAPAKTELPTGKVPLETFAAPGRAKAPAAQTPPVEKETISTAQITAFYVAVARGDYRGRDEEKNRLEQMIFDAQADGRVTP